MSDASTLPTSTPNPKTEKKFCLACANNKKDGLITPSVDGRCPVCSSDSLLSIDALTKFLGSKTNEQNLSVQEENALVDDLSTSGDGSLPSSYAKAKPVRPNMVLHEVTVAIKFTPNDNPAILRCIRFAMSSKEAIEQASKDPSQPWYLHQGILRPENLQSIAVNRDYKNPLKD